MNALMPGFEAGHYTLPKNLIEAAKEADALRDALDEQEIASVDDVERKFHEDILKSARAGKPLPDGSELIQARVAAEVHRERLDVLRSAAEKAERHERSLFRHLQLSILVEHLQPAFAETLQKARKAKASELPDFRARYTSIRSARSQLNLLVVERDTFGTFAEFRDLDAFWPEFHRERSKARAKRMVISTAKEIRERGEGEPTFTPAPWPADARERFKWSLTREPWLPTPQQQDARYEEFLAEARADLSKRQQAWREKNWKTA